MNPVPSGVFYHRGILLKKILERTSHVCTLENIWCISALNLNFLSFEGLTYSLNGSLTGFFKKLFSFALLQLS